MVVSGLRETNRAWVGSLPQTPAQQRRHSIGRFSYLIYTPSVQARQDRPDRAEVEQIASYGKEKEGPTPPWFDPDRTPRRPNPYQTYHSRQTTKNAHVPIAELCVASLKR